MRIILTDKMISEFKNPHERRIATYGDGFSEGIEAGMKL